MGKRGNNEGSIYKRPDGRWVAAVTLPGGKRRAFYGKTRTEVAAKLADALKDVKDNVPLPPQRQTVGSYLDRWLRDVAKPSIRPSTYGSYSDIVRLHLTPALGKITLAKLTPEHVQKMLNAKKAEGLSARRVQMIRAVLRRALNQAIKWGLVVRNAAALASPPKLERYQIRPWTPEQSRHFLDSVRTDRLSALFTLALATGARQGELLALKWPDVDFDTGELHIRGTLQRVDGVLTVCEPKTDRGRRSIALPEPIVSVLKNHRIQQLEERLRAGDEWQDEGFVFTTALGKALDGSVVTHRFYKLTERAGLPRQRFHDLRHCAASYLLAQGTSARVVMEILGHSQISLTMNTYSHVVPALQREATAQLGALLVGQA